MLKNEVQPEEEKTFQFVCRGCSMRDRERLWHFFVSSIGSDINREIDNSYLTLEEEPNNAHDPNAVQVVCRGEAFGMMGYVGKEYAVEVKAILKECADYRLDMVDEEAAGNREILLEMTWK